VDGCVRGGVQSNMDVHTHFFCSTSKYCIGVDILTIHTVTASPLRAKMGPGVEVIMSGETSFSSRRSRETRLRREVVSLTRSPLPSPLSTGLGHGYILELATLNRFVFSGCFKFYKSGCCHASLVLLFCKNLVVGAHSLQQFFFVVRYYSLL
jgi:hypothetical protein